MYMISMEGNLATANEITNTFFGPPITVTENYHIRQISSMWMKCLLDILLFVIVNSDKSIYGIFHIQKKKMKKLFIYCYVMISLGY